MKTDQARTHPASLRRVAEAQAEVYLLAFQALSPEAKELVREQILRVKNIPPDLAAELESWSTAASEALFEFEATVCETQ